MVSLVSGTQILMSDCSIKKVEDINIGDRIITYKNTIKTIKNKYCNKYNGNIILLKVANSTPIKCLNDLNIII